MNEEVSLKMPAPTIHEMAEAFNTSSKRGEWKAMPYPKTGAVHFDDGKGMVTLIYTERTGEYQVRFRKAVGAFGDYCNAIARTLSTILSALQAGGIPVAAPKGPEGVEIVIRHNGAGNLVSCRYMDPEIF